MHREVVVRVTQIVYLFVHLIMIIMQLRISYKFFKEAKQIAEVGRLAKILLHLGNFSMISSLVWEVYYNVNTLIKCNEASAIIHLLFDIARNLPLFIILAYWMRFLRVQVQLRA